MKSIKISGSTREYLKRYDNQSFTKIIDKLIDETSKDMPHVIFDDTEASPIKVNVDVYDKLVNLAISNMESIDSIIMRMLILVDGVDLIEG